MQRNLRPKSKEIASICHVSMWFRNTAASNPRRQTVSAPETPEEFAKRVITEFPSKTLIDAITARDKQVAEAASERMRERAAQIMPMAVNRNQNEAYAALRAEIRALPLTEPADS
jgi:hypothetical protein